MERIVHAHRAFRKHDASHLSVRNLQSCVLDNTDRLNMVTT